MPNNRHNQPNNESGSENRDNAQHMLEHDAEYKAAFTKAVEELEKLRKHAQNVDQLQRELADARDKPLKSFKRKQMSRLLFWLSEREKWFSESRRNRFLNSAEKRDPRRSVRHLDDSSYDKKSLRKTARASSLDRRWNKLRAEQRTPSAANSQNFDETVMVVSHEATRSGAPVLALNLINELSKRFNVVAITFGGGELSSDFAAASMASFELNRRIMRPEKISQNVAELCKKYDVSMAFVNSVESRYALPGLQSAGVPSVAMLHEFASSIRPSSAFKEVFANADHVVFSTGITLEDAQIRSWIERPINVHVLHQGKCATRPEDKVLDEDERQWLNSVLRPNGEDDKEFLVIGAGAIEYRKGIDLFVETATRIVSAPGGGNFRFVWIGHGFDPEKDLHSSGYLSDQIERAGVQTQVQIVRATSDIDHAYDCADLLLLTSRLDPLPNVAIDMLIAGKPVMCFNRTTGIAEFLEDAGLGDDCIASYLDTSEMASKIRALADSPVRLAEVSKRGAQFAKETFDFTNYARQLVDIVETGGRKVDRIDADLKYIRESGAFRSDFYRPYRSALTDEDEIIEDYLQTNRSGPYIRKPSPGFNQLIYSEENGWGKAKDPFVEFLEKGEPEGRWKSQVIDDTSPIDDAATSASRVALHVHGFFVEEFRDVLRRVQLNKTRPDLFVSAPESKIELMRNELQSYDGHVAAIEAVPNRGRDIAPFLTLFGSRLVSNYDIVGHVHTKRSKHVNDRKVVNKWVEFLMENTLGGPNGGRMLDRIVTAMSTSSELGMVYPDDPDTIGWTKNKAHAAKIAKRMGIADLPQHLNYPVGTMFWARASLIERFVLLNLDWNDYPPEPLPIDGSMLHAIERLFGVVPHEAGFRTGATNVRGLTR